MRGLSFDHSDKYRLTRVGGLAYCPIFVERKGGYPSERGLSKSWSKHDTVCHPPPTQSFNAGFILLFAPVFAALWAFLGKRGRDPDPMIKFGLGLAQVGLGFLVIVWSAGLADASFRVPLLVLAAAYLLHTTGELCLSPVGLSEITKLAPAVLISTLMSLWFMAISAAEFIGALIARLAGSNTAGGKVLDPHASLIASLNVFQWIGWAGVGFGVAFLIAAPFAHRLAHGVNDPLPEGGAIPAPAE